MAKYRFKVLATQHYDRFTDPETGETDVSHRYNKGDIVESDIELDKKFVNKFERLPNNETAPTPAPLPTAAADPPSVGPGANRKTKNTPGKDAGFEAEQQQKGQTAETKDEPESLGVDVTDDFPKAGEADLKVFQDGTDYYVTEPQTPDKPMNKEPLKRKDVVAFVNKQAG